MKPSIGLLAAVVLSCATSASAAEVRLGELLSTNFARTSLGDLPPGFETGFQPHWGVGAVVGLSWGQRSALVLSPGYLKKGGTLSTPTGEPESKYDFGYLEIPLEFRYALSGRKTRPYVLAGTSLGFLQRAKLHPGTGPDVDLKDENRTVDVSVFAGVGIEVPGRWGRGFFDVVAQQGLRDLNALGTGFEVHQQSVSVRAGWTFGLRRGQAGSAAADRER